MDTGTRHHGGPNAAYFIGGLLGMLFVLLCVALYVYLTYIDDSGPTSYHQPESNYPIFAFFFTYLVPLGLLAGITAVSLYSFNLGSIRYEWDDETLRCRTLLGSITMGWHEFTELEIKSSWWRQVIFLKQLGGPQIPIHFTLISDDCGLLDTLHHRLQNLFDNTVADGTMTSGNFAFDSKGLRICVSGVVQLLPYDAIRYVFLDAKYKWGLFKELESLTFADESGDRACITSQDRQYNRARLYFKTRLPAAAWIDMTTGKPPTPPDTALRYHVRRLAKARADLRAVWHALTIATAILAGIIYYNHAHGKAWHYGAFFAFFLWELEILYVLFRALWMRYVSSGALRKQGLVPEASSLDRIRIS